MPEFFAVRSHQRKLSVIRLTEDGNRCNDKAGFRRYTLSTVKNSSWTQLGEKVPESLYSGKSDLVPDLRSVRGVRLHTEGTFCTGVSLRAETLSDLLEAGDT